MEIKLYSQGCPKCKVLSTKLKLKNINFIEVEDFDIEELSNRGIKSLPVLEVDGELMKFEDAIKWVKEY